MRRNITVQFPADKMKTLEEISKVEARPLANVVRLLALDRLAELETQKGEIHANK